MSIQPEHLLCPIMVGRDDELAFLSAALDRTVRGATRGVIIGGEAGMGKSRLCRALIKEARGRKLNPLIGLCAPQDAALPYGPLVDALRRASTRAGRTTIAADPTLGAVLGALLPEPGTGAAAAPGVVDSPAMVRQRLFSALARALRSAGAGQGDTAAQCGPLVLILEDLHWADDSTLDFLRFLLRAQRGIDDEDAREGDGLLVVATFRSERLAEMPALARTLSDLLSSRLVAQLESRPLTREQMAQLLEASLGRAASTDTVAAFFERSEGSPFVAEELLGALAATGQLERGAREGIVVSSLRLPLSLRAAVLDRVDLLPADARTFLSAAAVAGRNFDLDVVTAAAGLRDQELLDALRRCVRDGLIEENQARAGSTLAAIDDSYRFRHALTREVIYDELLAPERRSLHGAIAAALEGRGAETAAAGDGEMVEALAYHYHLAGDRVKAPRFAIRAAERARALLAVAEARQHYTTALAYLPAGDPERLPLLEALGLLSLALLDLHGAIAHLDEASGLLRGLGLARKAAVVLGEIHHLLWYVDPRRFRDMVAELDALAEDARDGRDGGGEEDADALAIYAAVALAHAIYDNHVRAILWSQRALDLAAVLDRDDSPAAQTTSRYKALLARGAARLHGQGDVAATAEDMAAAGLRDLRQALDVGLRHGLPEVVQLAYNALPRGLLDVGRDAEAAALIDEAEDYARRSGVAPIADSRGYSLLYAGRWEEGIAAMRAAIEQSRAAGALPKMALEQTALGHLLVSRGDGQAASAVLREALDVLEPGEQFLTLAPCLAGLARASALLGAVDEAEALFERGHALWRTTGDHVTAVPLLLEGCLFYAERGDAARAMAWADDLTRLAHANPTPATAAAACHAAGIARLVDGVDARAALSEAVDRWEELGRPYDAARARAALGQAMLAVVPQDKARRAGADALLVAAADAFARLGADHDRALVEDVRRRAGLLSQARRRQSLAEGHSPSGNLTARERDVLALLAEGRTNREIARALFITEGTAELHVSRILSKLGCATRAQAAAYAVTHHLATTS